jgi:hypothetical protein
MRHVTEGLAAIFVRDRVHKVREQGHTRVGLLTGQQVLAAQAIPRDAPLQTKKALLGRANRHPLAGFLTTDGIFRPGAGPQATKVRAVPGQARQPLRAGVAPILEKITGPAFQRL